MTTLTPPPLSLPSQFSDDTEVSNFFDGLLKTVYQMWAEVFSLRFKAKTLTTDATVTPLQRILVDTNRTVYIHATVVARRTGGSAGTVGDSAWYVIDAGFKNIAGTVTLIASIILNGGEDQPAWDLGFAISGNQAVLVGTGAANNNITWSSVVSFQEVGV